MDKSNYTIVPHATDSATVVIKSTDSDMLNFVSIVMIDRFGLAKNELNIPKMSVDKAIEFIDLWYATVEQAEQLANRQITPEFLAELLVSEEYFEVGEKLLHFNTWETENGNITQLLCRDMGIVSTVLLSVCLQPTNVYTSHTINTYIDSEVENMAMAAIFTHLRKKCR